VNIVVLREQPLACFGRDLGSNLGTRPKTTSALRKDPLSRESRKGRLTNAGKIEYGEGEQPKCASTPGLRQGKLHACTAWFSLKVCRILFAMLAGQTRHRTPAKARAR
jgi:hypothetical protein